MKRFLASLFTSVLMFSSAAVGSEENGCIEEIAAATVEIAQTKAKLLQLIAEMRRFDNTLLTQINEMDKRIVSSIDSNYNYQKTGITMRQAASHTEKTVRTHDIAAKARLAYLKAVILRYQFYASKILSEEVAEYKTKN